MSQDLEYSPEILLDVVVQVFPTSPESETPSIQINAITDS